MKKRIGTSSSAKATEVPAVIIGIIVASFVSFLLLIGLTSLIVNGTVNEVGTGSYIFIIRTIAAAIGCLTGTVLMKGKYLLIAGAIALGYMIVLLAMGIVLFDSSFKNILSGAASVLLGGAVACFVVLKPLKKSKPAARYRR